MYVKRPCHELENMDLTRMEIREDTGKYDKTGDRTQNDPDDDGQIEKKENLRSLQKPLCVYLPYTTECI